MSGRVFIGTSGWTYSNWRGTFHPQDLANNRLLDFYSREFLTTEVNYSFYRLPRPTTYAGWAGQVPEGFLFAVKANRMITHTKRLANVQEPWQAFVTNAEALGSHLGPILLQFPPSFRRQANRLAEFLERTRKGIPDDSRLKLVFEFRHESWFTEEIYRLLERYEAALCIADSPRYPRKEVLTTNCLYLRFHGRRRLFESGYSEAELEEEARKVERYLREGLDVFLYFNNTARGHAIDNARTLKRLLGAE
ncbi:MAG: DUF72 domain-containing protein [Nitrospiraceae bacterium]